MLDFSNKTHQYDTLASHHTSQKANCSPVAQLEKWGLPAAELHIALQRVFVCKVYIQKLAIHRTQKVVLVWTF